MPEISPLLLALAISIAGTTLHVWYQHGGPGWMFALGGFLSILGRLMIAVLCAIPALYVVSRIEEMERDGVLLIAVPTALILAIGAWSLWVVARSVYYDRFGPSQAQAARARRAPQQGRR